MYYKSANRSIEEGKNTEQVKLSLVTMEHINQLPPNYIEVNE